MTLAPQRQALPDADPIEEIVDKYVQGARSGTRPTAYTRESRGDVTWHRVKEDDQFRVLEHVIAVRERRVEWIWRNQDFWPASRLTDITTSDEVLRTVGVIHDANTIHGVKFWLGPARGAARDPDRCLPFVSNYNHIEAHYRHDGTAMRLDRARVGVDFLTKVGKTVLARAVRDEDATHVNRGFGYRASLGNRLLLRVSGGDDIFMDLPIKLSESEVSSLFDAVRDPNPLERGSPADSLFAVSRNGELS